MSNRLVAATRHHSSSSRSTFSTMCWFIVCLIVLVFGWLFTSLWLAVVSVAVMLGSAWLLSSSVEIFNYRRITILSFWYVTYLAMIFVPAFVVFADHEGPFRARYLFAVESVAITVPLGALLAGAVFGFRRSQTEEFFSRPLDSGLEAQGPVRSVAWVLFMCLFCALWYFREVGTVPLFYIFSNPGEHLALAFLREDSFKLLNSNWLYLYALVRAAIFPFVIAVSLGYWLTSKKREWLWLTLLSAGGGLLMAAASAAKKPVAAIFLVLGLFVYLLRRGEFSRKAIVICLTLILIFPFGVVSLAYESSNLTFLDIAQSLGTRMFSLPSEVVYYYFEVFPADTGFLYGRSIDKFARLTGREYFDTPNYVGQYGFPQDLESVSANGAFISDLHADFGMPGVLLGGLLAGVLIQAIHIVLIRRKKTIVNLACYAFLIYGFWDLNSTSLPIVLASNGTLLLLLLAAVLDRTPSQRKFFPLRHPQSGYQDA